MNLIEGIATIFTLHRVYPPEEGKIHANENMKISPEFLESFILESLNRGHRFISLDELYSILVTRKKVSKKNIIITIDDGYLDNYTHAYPIFKKYKIPFAIYLTTSFPNKTANLWWYAVAELVETLDEVIIASGERFSCKTLEEKNNVFLTLREKILKFVDSERDVEIKKLLSRYSLNLHSSVEKMALSWEHLAEMSNDSLVTIGAHTVNHFVSSSLELKKFEEEVLASKFEIENKLKVSVEHFCYPFGARDDSGKREFELIKKLKFKTATTTRFGNIFNSHRKNLTSMPRVMLTNSFSWHAHKKMSFYRFLKGRLVTE